MPAATERLFSLNFAENIQCRRMCVFLWQPNIRRNIYVEVEYRFLEWEWVSNSLHMK